MLHRPDRCIELQWAAPTRNDLAELSELLTAMEEADAAVERHTPAQLAESFAAAEEPAAECRLGRDLSGSLVAYGWNHRYPDDADPRRVHAQGGVHPEWRHRGIGRSLLGWQLAQARVWWARTWTEAAGPLQVVSYVDEGLPGPPALYQSLGLLPVRWYADMMLSLPPGPAPLPEHVVPPGIRLVPMNRKRLSAVRAAHDEAFAGHDGSRPVDAQDWEEPGSEQQGHQQQGHEQHGHEQHGWAEGWTDRLGVRPAWRGRGIARAPLTASLSSFRDAGLTAAGLGVDSDDSGRDFGLYTSLGYRTTRTVVRYARTEHPEPPEQDQSAQQD